MGSFPHDARRSKIIGDNPNPDRLRPVFTVMGYNKTAEYKTKAIELWQQEDITYVLTAEPDGFAAQFAAVHGLCAPSMGWRVVDARPVFDHTVSQGQSPIFVPSVALNCQQLTGLAVQFYFFT